MTIRRSDHPRRGRTRSPLARVFVGAFVGVLALLTMAPAGASPQHAEGEREQGGQPYAPHWFPDEMREWSPASDPDAPFNRSRTPLAERVQDEDTGANPDADDRRVMVLSVFGNTSGNPSQGSDEFDAYLSEFWPYLDTLVFWGGSADEGLILTPNPTVTDAAHRNGVPVLGTVFLPPEAYGGDLQATRDLLRRDANGDFPVAEKLVEAARYYGFDGWFVNAETEGADAELAGDMRDFLAALRSEASDESDALRVLWYDSMVESGEIDWQNALNEQNNDFFDVSDLMFLNYDWDDELLRQSAAHADERGRDPADLHAGIDVGTDQFDIQGPLDTLYPTDGSDHGLSLGLYRPDFTLTSADDPAAYADRESRFWVGADGDPASSRADAAGFRGISSAVREHTPVTEAPFATFFGTGRGTGWFHDGKRWQNGDWNNLSAQDVLPTWRFMPRGPGAEGVTVGYDYERAWRGGSSLQLQGRLRDRVRLPLFATRIDIRQDTRVSLTGHGATGGTRQQLLLWFDGAAEPEVVPLDDPPSAEWDTQDVSLSAYQGRTLTRVGVQLAPEDEQAVHLDHHLGALRIGDDHTDTPDPPRAVRVAPGPDRDARVRWSPPRKRDANVDGDAVNRYQVEAVRPNGERRWLGSTTAHAYYVPDVPDDAVRIEVIGQNAAGERGRPGVGGVG